MTMTSGKDYGENRLRGKQYGKNRERITDGEKNIHLITLTRPNRFLVGQVALANTRDDFVSTNHISTDTESRTRHPLSSACRWIELQREGVGSYCQQGWLFMERRIGKMIQVCPRLPPPKEPRHLLTSRNKLTRIKQTVPTKHQQPG